MIMTPGPHICLINPYIWDFSAFDLWAKPLGLLYLAGTLRANGFQVHLLDCLDVHFKGAEALASAPIRKAFGTGKYFRQGLSKPVALEKIPYHYFRYGIPIDLFLKALKALPQPQAFLVTSLMTYWYPGLKETISILKKIFPATPVILGGLFATLMPDQARNRMGADYIITGAGEGAILNLLASLTGRSPTRVPVADDLDSFPLPAFDLYRTLPYICLLTSRGCPFSCPYCASQVLQPGFRQRSPDGVIDEILYWVRSRAVRDFVFYDDALLIGFERHLGPILEGLLKRGLDLRFHTPNALHIRELNESRARLLFRAGFRTLRMGLETTDWSRHRSWGGKLVQGDWERALRVLEKAGFEKKRIEVYLLAGLPGQTLGEIEQSIREVRALGIRPRLAEYSPIPQTPLWPEACRHSRFPLQEEPLYHNNSLFPCLSPFSWEAAQHLKDLAR